MPWAKMDVLSGTNHAKGGQHEPCAWLQPPPDLAARGRRWELTKFMAGLTGSATHADARALAGLMHKERLGECPTLVPACDFSKQEYWSGKPFPSPRDLPDPGMKPGSAALQADSFPSEPSGSSFLLVRSMLLYNYFLALASLLLLSYSFIKLASKRQAFLVGTWLSVVSGLALPFLPFGSACHLSLHSSPSSFLSGFLSLLPVLLCLPLCVFPSFPISLLHPVSVVLCVYVSSLSPSSSRSFSVFSCPVYLSVFVFSLLFLPPLPRKAVQVLRGAT